MNLVKGAFPYFILPFVISLVLVPLCKKIGYALGVYAEENQRTVHHGKIVRIGGLAIFLAFMLSCALYLSADDSINGILVGGFIIFLGGLIDDMFDLRPRYKLLFEIAAALIVMFYGRVYLTTINLPFGIEITNQIFCMVISFFWIIGITNAINLIDGLDGLSSGIAFIVVCVIGILGFFLQRRDICILSLILAGSILGFLPYNFHPASIFVGDCGALFMGFILASLSLLGFKTAALITLGFPILVLFIPISDTLIAMVRRTLRGQRIMEADKGHLHHILMYKLKLGHRNTVLVLYLVTILFGGGALLLYFDPPLGTLAIFILALIFELFVEYTGMINPKFHPLIGLFRRITGHPKVIMAEKEDIEADLMNHDGPKDTTKS